MSSHWVLGDLRGKASERVWETEKVKEKVNETVKE
jgi:hypothetical protein